MNEQAIRDGVRGFNVRRRQGGDALVEVAECRGGFLALTLDDVRVELRWPLDAESIWFVTEPDWVASVVNEDTLAGRITTLQPLLAKVCVVVDTAAQPSDDGSSAASLSQSAHSLDASAASLALSLSGSIEINDGRNFHLSAREFALLSAQIEEAQAVLGADRVKLVHELGAVKMCIDVFEMFDAEVATRLGFHAGDPVFCSFNYDKSAVPIVSCTQLREPGFGVRHHLKSIIEHFFRYWAEDRSELARRGRPPKELMMNFNGAVKAKETTAPLAADVRNSNNNNNNTAASSAKTGPAVPASTPTPDAPKKLPWWKGLLFGTNARSKTSAGAVAAAPASPAVAPLAPSPADALTKEMTYLRELGFDDVACVRALLRTKGNLERATSELLEDAAAQSTPEQMALCSELRGMGFAAPTCAAALLKSDFNLDAASLLCLEPDQLWADALPVTQPELKRSKTDPVVADDERQPAEVSPDNVIFALMSYLQERLGHYCSYCVSCQAPHSCFNPQGGVVCCKPLCVFQLEGTQLESMVSVRQCPFKDCHNLDLTLVGREFLGMPLQDLCDDYGISPVQLLEMMLHRYLPGPEMKKFLNDGLKKAKQAGTKQLVVTTVLNPALCARFEHGWKRLREKRPDMNIVPAVAYHGTSNAGVNGITDKGFLLDKLGSNTHNRGAYGAGIYCSQNVQTAMAYARDGRLIVCAVLMGRVYKCGQQSGSMLGVPLKDGFDSHEDPSGQEWVVFDETLILPCYIVQFR